MVFISILAVAYLITFLFPEIINANSVTPDESCRIGSGNNCDLNSYQSGKIVQVFPGKKTACLETDAEYSFIFRKGASDKLLFYFQGGGSCLNSVRYTYHEFVALS